MKLTNIFKKSTKIIAKTNIETLAKNQLEKVIGGADDTATTTAATSTDAASKTMGQKAKAWMVAN